MEIPGVRGPMSVPPEKGPGEGRKAGEARERSAAGASDTVHLSLARGTRPASAGSPGEPVEPFEAGREALLEAVRLRLESGDLDRPRVFRETAEKILRGA